MEKKKDLITSFNELKRMHPDAILLYRVGDFYESYFNDAYTLSKILGVTLVKYLTIKDKNGSPIPTVGFPYHALDTYLPKIIRAGKRLAICDYPY